MLDLSVLLTIAKATQAVFGTPIQARTTYAVKGAHPVPRQWTKLGRAPREQMLHLQIGVKQSQFDELERHLYEVSYPDHERYGNHLSVEDVNELIKPTDEALDLVHEWLLSNGVGKVNYSPAQDWVNIYIDVESAERLLDTEYYVCEHEDGTQLSRCPEWSLPKHLHEHIDTIQPTTAFMRPKAMAYQWKQFDTPWTPPDYTPPSDAAIAAACSINGTTPNCFQTLYQTKGYIQKVPGINQIGFNNFLGEIPIQPDAVQFLQKYAPFAIPGAYTVKRIDIAGGPSQTGPLNATQAEAGIAHEANLDFQTILGMTYPMPVTAYSTGGAPPQIPDAAAGDPPGNEPYLTWVNYVLSQPFLPQVISTSYADDEQTVPLDYARRVCNSFAQLGARRHSLLFASGDGGVGAIGENNASLCVSNDGKNTFKFLPEFPTSCPYITAVGATQNFEPEVVAYRPANSLGPDGKLHGFYASGGGFSEYFARPSYQDAVVPAYVESLNGEYAGLFNPNGRGYPDISAQGLYFDYVWNGTFGIISGTSASTPLMSSILALVNDALISSGKPPLGFLNPWLYKTGYAGFTDIVNGFNGGYNTTGFSAVEGWDAVSGFGTPVFPKIVELAGGNFQVMGDGDGGKLISGITSG